LTRDLEQKKSEVEQSMKRVAYVQQLFKHEEAKWQQAMGKLKGEQEQIVKKFEEQIATLKGQASEAMEQMGKAKNGEGKIRQELVALEEQREFEINEFTKVIEEQKEQIDKLCEQVA